MDRKIIALVIIVLIVLVMGVYIFATQNTSNQTINNTTNTTNTAQIVAKNTSNSSSNNTTNVKVSAAQAQAIAIGSAKELGGQNDTAGTPTLFKWTKNNLHTWAWNVPLFDAVTKKSDGSLDVDAETGVVIMNE